MYNNNNKKRTQGKLQLGIDYNKNNAEPENGKVGLTNVTSNETFIGCRNNAVLNTGLCNDHKNGI